VRRQKFEPAEFIRYETLTVVNQGCTLQVTLSRIIIDQLRFSTRRRGWYLAGSRFFIPDEQYAAALERAGAPVSLAERERAAALAEVAPS